MRSVLYISYDGMTDPLGMSQVIPYLIGLSPTYKITILSFEKPALAARHGAEIAALLERHRIGWEPLSFTRSPPVLAKVYDRTRLLRRAERLCKTHTFDIIHCRSYIAAEAGIRLKAKFGSRFLFDMRGFWPDEKVDSGHWRLANPLYRLIYRHYKTREKKFLQAADAIVTLTQAAKNTLITAMGIDGDRVTVIPCCADLAFFDYHTVGAAAVAAVKARLEIPPGSKVLCYAGSTGGFYLTREVLLFFKIFLAHQPGAVLLFLTKDAPEALHAQAAEVGVPRASYRVTAAARAEMPLYLAAANLGIFFIRPSFSKRGSSPTRHAEYMGMGIPVVCNAIGDTGDIVTRTGTGVVVDDFSSESFEHVQASVERLSALDPDYVRRAAFDYFDHTVGSGRYASVYYNISG